MNKKLKKTVQEMKKERLAKLIFGLAKLRKENEIWLETSLFGATDKSIDYYKRIILSAFYNKRGGPRLRLSVARNAIRGFERLSSEKEATIDLMLFFVETGVEFTSKYGDIHEAFYSNMEIAYQNAIQHLNTRKDPALMKKFRPRLKLLVEKTNGMGWGFHDSLEWMYKELR